jgi:flagellin-like protein
VVIVKFRLRGISPVVATALLVLIAIATAAILYLWVSGAPSSQTTGQEVLYERIKIDAVRYSPLPNNITLAIYVRNTGDIPVNISGAFLLNPAGSVVAANTTDKIRNVNIPAGGIARVLINLTDLGVGALQPGVYVVKVTTINGIEATYTLTVRQ